MGFTGNLQLDKIDQGQVRFDLALNSALEKLDAHFSGSDAGVLGLGHASKTISFRPLGTERATLNAELLSLTVGLKLGNFSGTPAAGIIRWTGTSFEGYDGAVWNRLGRAEVVATASLPAAGAANDGRILIEDVGAGDRNLIIYAGGQRFRIDGGAAI